MDKSTIFGMNIKTVTAILFVAVILLIILVFIIIYKMNIISRKYSALMSGKKGLT